MLIIGLVFSIVYISIVPIFSEAVKSIHFVRCAVMVFLLCLITGLPIIFDSYSQLHTVEIYHSVFIYSPISFIIYSLLYVVSALTLICFHTRFNLSIIKLPEYSLILIFSVLGATMIISANDLISMYIALELQSFALYILACIRIDLTSSTHASLKYFLLGAMSSAFILLGMSLVYEQLGTTNFSEINAYMETLAVQIQNISASGAIFNDSILVVLGLMSILCGCIFKISAAPFHSWFSDVIQGVPTYTSIIIINIPKISIFAFLFNFLNHTVYVTNLTSVQMFILVTTIFSLVLGTVAGLVQTKIKRLLAFSTISHVGFLLISLVVGNEAESSINALIFYISQYTLVTVLTFISLIAYENYIHRTNPMLKAGTGINNIVDLQGMGHYYKTLTFTFVLCLFSIAGIPPLTGFYAKLEMLNSSIITNHPVLFITAIVCSVISAAYYLKIIKIVMFDKYSQSHSHNSMSHSITLETGLDNFVNLKNRAMNEVFISNELSSLQSYVIAVLTAFITLFILDPKLIINGTELAALALYVT